jgi:hypothetical protein
VSIEAFFTEARNLKRELTGSGLSQAEVDALNAIIEPWGHKPVVNPTALGDGGEFFSAVRKAFGPLTQEQVDGFGVLLQAFGVARWPLSWAAYGLATAWHETAARMEPVKEAYWLSGIPPQFRKAAVIGRGCPACPRDIRGGEDPRSPRHCHPRSQAGRRQRESRSQG